jgi:hypothetical protein
MRTSGQGDIEPIVDQHPCPRADRRLDAPCDEAHQGAAVHIAFSDLNEVNAGRNGGGNTAYKAILRLITEAESVGDHADDRAHRTRIHGNHV